MPVHIRVIAALVAIVALTTGCASTQPVVAPGAPPDTPATATAMAIPPADTPAPSVTSEPTIDTASLPTAEPDMPPTSTPQPVTYDVCAAGCDFATIQAALDDPDTPASAVIEIADAIHTEAGIVVAKDATIRGQGSADTIVQAHDEAGAATARVFLVEEGATVVLEDMTIRHGRPLPKEEVGGGILNLGTLTVQRCVVTSNSAIGGGGISSEGDMMLISSTVRNNVARGDGPRGEECGGGGGVKSSRGNLTIVNSTITGNRAGIRSEGLGGGIRTGCGCTAEILNSTISGNKAARYGGAIAASGTVHIANCTLSQNIVRSAGGALWIRGKVDIENTIVADNSVAGKGCVIGGEGGHVGKGSIGMSTHNLVEDGSCDADFSGDPVLGPLSDNGGLTLTHALRPDSPAIDAIPAISCTLPTDQRGMARPVAQTAPGTPCDIGAFEAQPD